MTHGLKTHARSPRRRHPLQRVILGGMITAPFPINGVPAANVASWGVSWAGGHPPFGNLPSMGWQ